MKATTKKLVIIIISLIVTATISFAHMAHERSGSAENYLEHPALDQLARFYAAAAH